MNKHIISFVVPSLLVVGAAAYLGLTLQAGETKAGVNISGDRSEFDLFKSYATWPNSTARKATTAAQWLHTMAPGSPSDPPQVVDINGDGLVDILVHLEKINIEAGVYHWYYGVLLNRGDLTFDLAYKCVHTFVSGVSRFYGDCTQ